jgi:hypothetical protein
LHALALDITVKDGGIKRQIVADVCKPGLWTRIRPRGIIRSLVVYSYRPVGGCSLPLAKRLLRGRDKKALLHRAWRKIPGRRVACLEQAISTGRSRNLLAGERHDYLFKRRFETRRSRIIPN